MASKDQRVMGSVISLWRYPVKSMMGEELGASGITERGLLGDRAYALVDTSTGKVASAKNPRKWSDLFDFRATFVEPPRTDGKLSPVQITLPNGTTVHSEQSDCNQILSKTLGREVILQKTPPKTPCLEEYWPDIDGLAHRDTITDEAMPAGTFFDLAVFHVLSTATINRLQELYPQGRFELPRFRPNIVVEPIPGEKGFVDNNWIGHTLAIGKEVRLKVTGPCPRCVMTTLPQGKLPKDPGILRTAAQHNQTHVGVYANMVQGGTIRRGDRVKLE